MKEGNNDNSLAIVFEANIVEIHVSEIQPKIISIQNPFCWNVTNGRHGSHAMLSENFSQLHHCNIIHHNWNRNAQTWIGMDDNLDIILFAVEILRFVCRDFIVATINYDYNNYYANALTHFVLWNMYSGGMWWIMRIHCWTLMQRLQFAFIEILNGLND